MKQILICCLVIMGTLRVFAQQTAKNDVILKLNGEELNGKVLKINDNDIEFAYAGETLSYTNFWNTQGAYKNTLEYLLKRSPLYTK
jgi:hypothetical protein